MGKHKKGPKSKKCLQSGEKVKLDIHVQKDIVDAQDKVTAANSMIDPKQRPNGRCNFSKASYMFTWEKLK
jgi:hypothetical protein